jgi:hypothetical protein
MAKWSEAAVESAFKPVAGGYIAKLPVRDFLGRTRSYVVNDAQKQEIGAALRRQRVMMLCILPILLVLGAAFGLMVWALRLTPGELLAGMAALLVVVFLAMGVGPVGYLRRELRPILGTLQPSDQSISLREQVETIARRIPAPILVVGLIGGCLMVAGNIMAALDAAHAQRLSGALLAFQLFAAGAGVAMTAYFIWLTVLRMRNR